jgi:hypothetical protein
MATGWSSSGSFKSLEAQLQKMRDGQIFEQLTHYGQEGVSALSAATPAESGVTASSWSFEIIRDATSWSIVWGNSNMAGPTPVAVLIQLGHGTGTGGYVEGRDFINPALQPIFDRIANDAWKAVTG